MIERNVPRLRFPGFEAEWERRTLGEVSTGVMYGMNAAAIPYDGKNKYLRITDIDDNTRGFIPNPLTSPDGKIEYKYKLQSGDICFTRTGASVGKSYLYNEDDGNLYFAGFLIKFSVVNANPYFAYSYTLKDSYDKWVKLMSMRSGQPGINAEEYKSLPIYITDLQEQDKIQSFLQTIDNKLNGFKKKKSLLEQYKKGMMQKIFNQEVRFKDDDGKEFAEWEEMPMSQIFKRKTKKNIDGKITTVLTNSAVRGIVLQQDYFDKEIANVDSIKTYYVVGQNDFVYNPRISEHAPVGPFKRNKIQVGIMSPLYSIFSVIDGNLDFFQYYFETVLWHDYMNSIANFGARHDRMNIKISDFEQLPLPFPEIEEQTYIANFLSAIDDKINLVAQQIEKSEVWKKGLLGKMFL